MAKQWKSRTSGKRKGQHFRSSGAGHSHVRPYVAGVKTVGIPKRTANRLRSKAYGGEIIEFKPVNGKVVAISNGTVIGRGVDRDDAFKDVKRRMREKYNREHNITATNLRYKSQAVPLKVLKAQRDAKWNEIHEMEKRGYREGWSAEKQHSERMKIVCKHEPYLKQPNLKPIIYKTSIGHYGGLYVDVPEEHFTEFKSYFPSREFPRSVETVDVRDKYTFEGEKNFRKRFPNSNRLKVVYFSSNSKGHQRLDYLDLPRPD